MKFIKIFLIVFLFLLFLLFAYSAIGIMVKHYWGIYDDKISVEFGSSLIYSLYYTSLSIIFFQLFFSLYKHKYWQRIVFLIVMLLWMILQVMITLPLNWNPSNYIYFLILCDIVPALVGPYIIDHNLIPNKFSKGLGNNAAK